MIMNCEEKYKNALKRAREYKKHGYMMINVVLDNIFPELKESEDERIRKELIAFIKKRDRSGCDYDYDQWIAWLEKLKVFAEHGDGLYYFGNNGFTYVDNPTWDNVSWLEKQEDKPQGKTALEAITEEKVDNSNKVEPKFKIGDWIIRSNKAYKHNTYLIKEVKEYYVCEELKGRRVPFTFDDVHKNFKLWDIADAKDGDVLCYKDEISLFKHDIKDCTKQETTFGGFVYYCCYYGKRFIMDSLYSLTEQDKINIHPATKEQRDLLFSKMKEAGYEWDAEKKKLINNNKTATR